MIDKAAALGVEGVDVLHRQMDNEDRAYVQGLKRRAFVNGVSLDQPLHPDQDFVESRPGGDDEDIDHTCVHGTRARSSVSRACA